MPNTTWNPADKTASCVLSNGNLTATTNALGSQSVRTVDSRVSGKYYWEYTFTNTTNVACGIANSSATLTSTGISGATNTAYTNNGGSVYVNSTTGSAGLGAFTTGNIACIAVDLDNQLIFFRRGAAGNWNNSGTANPVTGAGGFALAFVGAGVAAFGLMSSQNGNPNGAITANFGDSAFAGLVPSGFASGFPGTIVSVTTQARAMVMA